MTPAGRTPGIPAVNKSPLGRGTFRGMGAIVLNGAGIGEYAFSRGGALVTERAYIFGRSTNKERDGGKDNCPDAERNRPDGALAD